MGTLDQALKLLHQGHELLSSLESIEPDVLPIVQKSARVFTDLVNLIKKPAPASGTDVTNGTNVSTDTDPNKIVPLVSPPAVTGSAPAPSTVTDPVAQTTTAPAAAGTSSAPPVNGDSPALPNATPEQPS